MSDKLTGRPGFLEGYNLDRLSYRDNPDVGPDFDGIRPLEPLLAQKCSEQFENGFSNGVPSEIISLVISAFRQSSSETERQCVGNSSYMTMFGMGGLDGDKPHTFYSTVDDARLFAHHAQVLEAIKRPEDLNPIEQLSNFQGFSALELELIIANMLNNLEFSSRIVWEESGRKLDHNPRPVIKNWADKIATSAALIGTSMDEHKRSHLAYNKNALFALATLIDGSQIYGGISQ